MKHKHNQEEEQMEQVTTSEGTGYTLGIGQLRALSSPLAQPATSPVTPPRDLSPRSAQQSYAPAVPTAPEPGEPTTLFTRNPGTGKTSEKRNAGKYGGLAAALLTVAVFAAFQHDALSQSFEPEGQLRNVGGVSYLPPKGWLVRQNGDVAVMTGPVPQQYQPCMIVIDPTVRPSGDMAAQLEMIVNYTFGPQFGQYHGESGVDLKMDQYQGVAVAGWPYVDLLGQLGGSGNHVRALLARFNERAVAVIGLFSTRWSGAGPLPPHAGEEASNCLGSSNVRDNDVFLMLFHSLRLPGFSGASPDLAKQLLGFWEAVDSRAGVRVAFAANGHFDDGGVKPNYYLSTNGVIYDFPSNFLGAGTYRLDGDRLTMTRASGSGRTTPVSVVRRPRPGRSGDYDEFLRRVEPADNQVWGFGRTGYFVTTYRRSH